MDLMLKLSGPLNSESMKSEERMYSEISLGTRFTLGRPATGFYKYLFESPSHASTAQKNLLPVNTLQGILVVTKGIMKLRDGSKLLCLVRINNEAFYGEVMRIYARLTQSVESRELIHL